MRRVIAFAAVLLLGCSGSDPLAEVATPDVGNDAAGETSAETTELADSAEIDGAADSSAPMDSADDAPADTFVPPADTGAADTSSPPTDTAPSSVDVVFPSSTDTVTVSTHEVHGDRLVSLPSIKHASATFFTPCGWGAACTPRLYLYIGATEVGHTDVVSSMCSLGGGVPISGDFAAVPGVLVGGKYQYGLIASWGFGAGCTPPGGSLLFNDKTTVTLK